MPRLRTVYPGICLTTEEIHGKPHSGYIFNLGLVQLYMLHYNLYIIYKKMYNDSQFYPLEDFFSHNKNPFKIKNVSFEK